MQTDSSRFSYSPSIVWFCDSMNKNQNSEHAQTTTFPLNVIWGVFHLLRNSENPIRDVNGTHVFWAYHVPGNNWKFRKVVLFSRWKISDEKACSIHEFSQGITGSSRLFKHGDICATILNFGDERINEWNLCQMQHRLFLMDFSRKVSERFWFWCLLCYLVSFVVILTVLVLKIKSIKLLSVNGKRPKSPATSTWQPHVSSSGKILTNIHEIKSCGLQFDRTKWDWYSQSILKFNLDTGEREVNGCKATNCTLRNYVKLVGIGN